MKYVLVSGGVISGIGKGIIASSTGLLLKTKGLKVSAIKIDPYMNVDAGTMAPTEHGEVFVLDDGGEVDLDLGNYERYLNIKLTRDNNITTGKIYQHVIERERKGDYLGRTVQVVPHLTDATQDWIERVARIPVDDTNEQPDACIIELGGTVGDIESAPFIEALRQLKKRAGRNNFAHIHVSLVPLVNMEQKSKPTQHAFKEVASRGPRPDLIACRCDVELEPSTLEKISLFCEVESEQVIGVHNVSSTYNVPALLEKQQLIPLLGDVLKLDALQISPALKEQGARTWQEWQQLTSPPTNNRKGVKIALVGKYTNLHDSYLSVIKSLEHSAMYCGRELELIWVDASQLEEECKQQRPEDFYKAWHDVTKADGILVPGGFGKRGTEGMIKAAQYAREKGKPYLGVCLGMQIAVIEYARHEGGLDGAGSVELDGDDVAPKIIVYMPEIDKARLGGTMRLGLRPTYFQSGSEWSRIRQLYAKSAQLRDLPVDGSIPNGHGRAVDGDSSDKDGEKTAQQQQQQQQQQQKPSETADAKMPAILERHRHRYEVNPEYIELLSSRGLNFVGKDEHGQRMEIVELRDHKYFVGVQYHPEYLSRVLEPSKPYLGLVAASIGCLDQILKDPAKGVGAEMDGLSVRV